MTGAEILALIAAAENADEVLEMAVKAHLVAVGLREISLGMRELEQSRGEDGRIPREILDAMFGSEVVKSDHASKEIDDLTGGAAPG